MAPECASSRSADTRVSVDSETTSINTLLTVCGGTALGTPDTVHGPHILDAEYATVRSIYTPDLN